MNLTWKVPATLGNVIMLHDGTAVKPDVTGCITADAKYTDELENLGMQQYGPIENQYTVVTSDTGLTAASQAATNFAGAKANFIKRMGSGASAGLALTDYFPDGSVLAAAQPNVQTGDTWRIRFINALSQGSLITLANSFTSTCSLIGTMTVSTNTWRDFMVTKTAQGVSITTVGAGTI